MKTKTRNYVIAGFYLAIIVTVVVAGLYLGWHDLLYLVALCLAGYGAYKLLSQTDIGQKMLELVFVAPYYYSYHYPDCYNIISSRRSTGLVAVVVHQRFTGVWVRDFRASWKRRICSWHRGVLGSYYNCSYNRLEKELARRAWWLVTLHLI